MTQSLLIATQNPHKLEEFKQLFLDAHLLTYPRIPRL